MLLTACNPVGPDYKVGDCITPDVELEPWDAKNIMIFHVVAVGNRKYKTLWLTPKIMIGVEEIKYIEVADRYYKKVTCPK